MTRQFRFTAEQSRQLSYAAYDKLLNNLKKYGNNPGPKQEAALKKLIETLTAMAGGETTGRLAFPIQTGLGKTQSIIAFASTLVEQGHYQVGMIVCASKVEALCDLKRALIAEGVPSERIGLVHSYKYDKNKAEKHFKEQCELPQGYASLHRTEDNQQRQILLATHQRIKGGVGLEGLNIYNGKPRNLLIWDESLLTSEARSVSFLDLARGLNLLDTPEVPKSDEQKKAIAYLKHCKAIIAADIERQKNDPSEKPRELTFPLLSDQQLTQYKNAIGEEDPVEPLKVLLKMSQNPLRVVADVEQGGGVITYDIVVPKELDNIVILDASHLIRDLARMDSTIVIANIESDIVSYENVTVHQLFFPSGRNSMNKEFGKRRGSRLVSKEIIDVIKGIPQDEGIIVFTFKRRGKLDFTHLLKSDLEDAGIDTEAEIEVNIGGTSATTEKIKKPRIVFLTWGNETSLSEFSYCSNVIFAGVLHRSHIDIGSAITGQKDDLCMELRNQQIRQVIQSEVAHCVYQAMSRGSSRVIDGALTRQMKVWLIHKSNLEPLIGRVMPGIKWRQWTPKYLPLSETKVSRLAEDIGGLIETFPGDLRSISTNKLKSLLTLQGVPPRSFTRAVKKAVSGQTGWEMRGRSLVRSTCPFL